ncbi:alpha/beta fold hydrolase [Pollutimonas sp. M17]|uniref:alpha/beta fold hydrolase n=1 Tax=Pollutimonas sp. M17 TaxID=2962065 RepID=UPI0021F4042F|nr:alpha/beta fold hydrolase [Pollutimonas sp. M17]UYO95244.1 alpha/beta fold hydrolase [Pollutimonas sp. M17]
MIPLPPSAQTFVLVHGAWHGGWCWSRVAARLRDAGHTVFTPTLTGLGERSHLLDAGITLQTFIDDIVNVLTWEDLNDVVLVGHSFGGLVITGAADAMPQRLRHLVYLDAFILESGVSTFDTLPVELVAKLRSAAQQQTGGAAALPPPKPKSLGLFEPDDVAFVQHRLTPQPLRSYETALQLRQPVGNGLPCTYLNCANPSFAGVDDARNWARNRTGWRWEDLDAGHDAMVSAPGLVTEALLRAAQAGQANTARLETERSEEP